MKSLIVSGTYDGQLIGLECEIDDDNTFACWFSARQAIELRDKLTVAVERSQKAPPAAPAPSADQVHADECYAANVNRKMGGNYPLVCECPKDAPSADILSSRSYDFAPSAALAPRAEPKCSACGKNVCDHDGDPPSGCPEDAPDAPSAEPASFGTLAAAAMRYVNACGTPAVKKEAEELMRVASEYASAPKDAPPTVGESRNMTPTERAAYRRITNALFTEDAPPTVGEHLYQRVQTWRMYFDREKIYEAIWLCDALLELKREIAASEAARTGLAAELEEAKKDRRMISASGVSEDYKLMERDRNAARAEVERLQKIETIAKRINADSGESTKAYPDPEPLRRFYVALCDLDAALSGAKGGGSG